MGLLNKVKISSLQKGIHDQVIITGVDVNDRKGVNGPINKMIYIKFTQLDAAGKRKAEAELSWWKPEVGNDYFKSSLQEMCLQLHNILACYLGEEAAFSAFDGVFEACGLESHLDMESKVWKKSEVDVLFMGLKTAFSSAITPFINDTTNPIRLKVTTNFKGEDIEIPKYGRIAEPMSVNPATLSFSNSELQTHSKAGNVEKKAHSSNLNASL